MAHDPRREDYQRLALRFACSLDGADPAAAARAFAGFGRRFQQDRDALPQSDADRAFHLVAMAAEVVDYRLPFAVGAQADRLIARGKALLDEALSLDPLCWDALRMRSSSEAPSIEERYRLLADRAEEVRASCEAARDEALRALDGERAALGGELALRPWWRWLATLAEEALICGHNHAAARAAERLLACDPSDSCDVRFTLAYALAKLEDERGLEELAARYATLSPTRAGDAWLALARMALAHRRCDYAKASEQVGWLIESYPGAAGVLLRQTELPDGEFSRLRVAPFSEDELVIAVSEGIVLLQEGTDRRGAGVLGEWLIRETARRDPAAWRTLRREAPDGRGRGDEAS